MTARLSYDVSFTGETIGGKGRRVSWGQQSEKRHKFPIFSPFCGEFEGEMSLRLTRKIAKAR